MSDAPSLSRDVGWGIGAGVLLHVIMIVVAVAWVVLYSFVFEPGHDQAFYEAYAGRASPIVSVAAGGPVFYLVSSWLTRRRGSGRGAWIAAAFYLLTDLAIWGASGALFEPVALYFLIGAILKLVGTALGVKRHRR